MKRWRVLFSVPILALSIGFILIGIPLLFEPFPSCWVGLVAILGVGIGFPYCWFYDWWVAKQKGEE